MNDPQNSSSPNQPAPLAPSEPVLPPPIQPVESLKCSVCTCLLSGTEHFICKNKECYKSFCLKCAKVDTQNPNSNKICVNCNAECEIRLYF